MSQTIFNDENLCCAGGHVIRSFVSKFFPKRIILFLSISVIFVGGIVNPIYAHQPTAFTRAVQPVEFVERVVPEPIDLQSIRLEDELREQEGGPYRFAIPRTVLITPDVNGMWEEIDDETRLWRIQITSPGSRSISLGFTHYLMPPGGSLFIYTADQRQVLGPFTEDDNEGHGQLWTPLIHSDDIVVELTIPASEVSQLELELTSINHGYRGFNPLLIDKGLGDSDYCHVNVACPEGDPWRDQIRSVAKYHITLADGSYLCTGVLINNTAEDDKNYFLTAFHCFDEWLDGVLDDPDNTAASMVIYWNFEAATCYGTTGPEDKTQSGAIFRAAYNPTDFTLVELDDMPSPVFDVYYAGWDRGSAAPSSGVAVHHPKGDLKKISFEYQPLSVTSSGGYLSPGNGTHLRVADWDYSGTNEGTTETGSSGCPIFNSSKRITGTLHGGLAACGNNESDWFGRFYKSWTGGGTSSTRLSNWLDSLGTGSVTLDGKNPTSGYCSASGGCYEYISGVVVGTINNIGTSCDGYADYTATSTIMKIGQSYDVTVTNGNPYSSDQCGIWVDWNQDCDFDDPEETIPVSGTPGNGPYTADITVPADANLGDTRMRIRITYTGDVNPCGETTYGEVEDYTITIPTDGCREEYPSTDVPKTIISGPYTSTLTISDTGTITDLNVKLNISHTYDSDLDVFLIGPDATRVELFTDVGGSGDNFSNTILDDEASVAITSGSAPFTGSYYPEGNLSDFYDKGITGTWTLEITDDYPSADNGTLNSWSLIIETCGGGCTLDAPVLHSEPNITPGLRNTIWWDPVADANWYYAQYANDANFANVVTSSRWIGETNYTFTGLDLGQTYWYRVKATPQIVNWSQTSQAEFQTDILVDAIATNDGDVVLAAGDVLAADTLGNANSNGTYSQQTILNVIECNENGLLTEIEMYLGIASSQTPQFVVYETPSESGGYGSYDLIHSNLITSGTGTGWYRSGQILVPLVAGKSYCIGVAWSGSSTFYCDFGAGFENISWGRKVSGRSIGIYPAPNSTSVIAYTGTSYYQNLITSGYSSSGSIVSTAINLPADGNWAWAVVRFDKTMPSDTALTIDVLNAADDSVILADVASGTELSGIAATSIKLRANLSTDDPNNNTPVLHDWSVSYAGPCESDWSNVESSRQCGTPGDFEPDCDVDWDDLAELVKQWLQIPDTPSADIAPLPDGDGIVNFLDFAEFAIHWLEGVE